ncbi:MAG: DMT family transporter [Bacteroidales bacterium]|nr:DMT family transporter [Bacteroidales bacterium]
MKTLSNQKKAYLLALLAVVFWSTMSSAFKITLGHIDYDQLLLWASLMGVVVLGLVNQFGNEPLRISNIKRKDLLSSALMGFFNPFLYYLVLFKAYDLLEAQIAGTLNYAWPLVLVLLSAPLLKQKIHPLSILAIFISFFGIVVISTHGKLLSFENINPFGVALAVGSAFFWAVYWILNMKDKRETTGKIGMNLFFGFVYILIFLLVSGRDIHFPGAKAMAGVAYIGAFEMSITFVIWLKALNYSANTAKVSNLIYLSPFFALFWINLAVGESIRTSTFTGLVFIILGIVLQQFLDLKRK